MKIALIGATGFVRIRLCCRKPLGRGHEVTAIVRSGKLPPHRHLHPRKADIYLMPRRLHVRYAVTTPFISIQSRMGNPDIFNLQVCQA